MWPFKPNKQHYPHISELRVKPPYMAPYWANYVGIQPDGHYWWLEKPSVVLKDGDPRYFPDGGRREYADYWSKKNGRFGEVFSIHGEPNDK